MSHWVEALKDPNPKTRRTAAQKLGNVGTTDHAALPALLGALRDEDPSVRCEVIIAIAKFGPEAQGAIPILADLRKNDPDEQVRDYAGKALAKVKQ